MTATAHIKPAYELRVLAVEELYGLRQAGRPEELARLDFWALRPASSDRDIFGQMTGVGSPIHRMGRHPELLGQILVPLTNYGEENKRCDWLPRRQYGGPLCAIEMYTMHPAAENKKVIEFLRGERSNLTADDL